MNNSRINGKVSIKTGQEKVKESNQTGVELSRNAWFVAGTFTALIGIWVTACFIGGLISSGGPIALLKSWFSAVSGM